MRESILHFPQSDYLLFSTFKNGYFYLDNVDDLIKNYLREGGVWEPHIQEAIDQFVRPGSTVLDIGAHIGTHTLAMARAVGAEGKVVAFEPQPKIFRELFLNMTVNHLTNILFYWAAVGDHEGEIELSPLVACNEAGTSIQGGSGQFVQLLTIDSLHLQDVSLMKIDVEGMEEQVLEGARETIFAQHPVIIIEIVGGQNFATTTQEVRWQIMHTIDKLEEWGYRVTQLRTHDWLAVPKLYHSQKIKS